jgi:hypothetical protein
MTKKLESLFDMEDDEQSVTTPLSDQPTDYAPVEVKQAAITNLEKIERALEEVKNLDKGDDEMDEIASMAKESYNNLMDLGMQVDSRFSAEIFNSASGFLGHALTAKTAKINKKLKMIQLQLQKAELDRKTAQANNSKTSATPDATDLGTGQVIDRGELIKQILAQAEHDKVTAKDK